MELSDKELDVLFERVDRCVSCITRWVDNKHMTKNAACLLAIKVLLCDVKDFSKESEQKQLSTLSEFLNKYIHAEFERKRKLSLLKLL